MGENGPEADITAHIPVLLEEIVGWLQCRPGGRYLDCTVGYGGHAEAILRASEPDGLLIGVDRDADALAATQRRLEQYERRLQLRQGNFREMRTHLASVGVSTVNGVLFDLGVSSVQLERPERGFGFSRQGPLDMRMDRRDTSTAADLVNILPEHALADLIYEYGEERYSRRIARAIVRRRTRAPLATTQDLVAAIGEAVPAAYRHGRLHFATRTFQALRIAVNKELEGLDEAFRDAAEVLEPGGRLCIISFHSLEDRIAKWTIRALSGGERPLLVPLTKKPQQPSEAEREANPRARSAKLRVAERLVEGRET